MMDTGQDILTCVNSQIIAGTITFATANYIKIQGFDVKSSTKIESKFYKSEMTIVESLKQQQIPGEETSCDFTIEELEYAAKMIRNVSYIERFDSAYHKAIADIESEEFIGFYVPDVSSGRFSETTVIVFSTSTAIYIFDIVNLGRIENAIKNILESKVQKKIVHDACPIADYLKHKQNIHLAGVFDTMVAHCSLGFDRKRFRLEECLYDHLKLPESFLDKAKEQWHRRPLSSTLKGIAAQNVVFLQKFHAKLTQLMLKDLHADGPTLHTK